MEALNKEIKQNAAVLALIGATEPKEPKEPKETVKKEKSAKQKVDWRKKNPRGYERNRGKDGSKAMSYYLPESIIRLLNIKAAKEGVTKSELVVEGLKYVLREEIKEEKAKAKKGETK